MSILIDWDNPLSDHPSNDGLVERWQAFPGTMGFGTTLMRGLRHRYPGTLTSMAIPDTATSGWGAATTRRGGRGEMRFDGTNDYVAVPNSSNLQPQTGLTISAWIKTATADRFVANMGPLTTGWAIAGVAAGTVRLYINSTALISVSVVTSNNWIHITGVWTPNVRMEWFFNGVSNAVATSSIPAAMTTNSNELQIGKRSTTDYWNGSIDDFRVYNRALSAGEVFQDYIDSQRWDDPTLNWIQRKTYSFPAAAVAGGLLLRRRRMIAA